MRVNHNAVTFTIVVIAIFVVIPGLLYLRASGTNKDSAEFNSSCIEKGGTPYTAYKKTSHMGQIPVRFCLKTDTIIEVE